MRENPLATLPDALFDQTHVIGPYLGRSVHQLSGPAEIRSVLQGNFVAWRKSPLILRMLRPILGDAILVAQGESWKSQRRTIRPAFKKKRVDHFMPLVATAADAATETLARTSDPVDAHALMNETTLSIIEQALFSSSEGFDRARVRSALEDLLLEVGTVRRTDLVPFAEWVPRPMSQRGRAALAVFREAASAQIQRRRASPDPGNDLLGLLLEAGEGAHEVGLSDDDIRDTLMTFVAAGHETTALALTWALYLVANDPDCQAALQAEAGEAWGEYGQLILTHQVIEEALRLFPPAPVLGRRAIEDTDICGVPVRKGDVALLAFYALQRHPRLWDHPERFDPDRWSADRRPADRYMSMAFGGGPRACIGAQFAMMEASIILATTLSRFTVEPTGARVEPVMQVTLRPKHGMPLRFHPR